MPGQRILLRIILICLGIAAIVGAAGVLFAQRSGIYRIDASLVLTAVCCGILMLSGRYLNDAAGQRAMVLSTSLVTIEFLLCMCLIWLIGSDLPNDLDEKLLATAVSIFAAGVPAVACMRATGTANLRAAAWVGIAFCIGTFLLWMIATWPAKFSSGDWHWFSYGNLFIAMGAVSVPLLVGVEQDRWHWRWIGILSALVGFMFSIECVQTDRWTAEPISALTTVAIVIALANLAFRCPLQPNQRWLPITTVVAALTGGFFTNWSLMQPREGSVVERLAEASGILAACGSLALIILMRLNRRTDLSAPSGGVTTRPIAVICPVCTRKLSIENGSANCGGCGLIIHASLEEPRCATCGYSLLMLKTDRCPECGAAVRPEMHLAKRRGIAVDPALA